MNRKKISAIIGLIFLFGFGYVLLFSERASEEISENSSEPATAGSDYIFDKNDSIQVEDVQKYRKKIDTSPAALKPDLKSGISLAANDDSDMKPTSKKSEIPAHLITPSTVKYFKFLQKRFKESMDLDDHFKAVEAFLLSGLSEEDAKAVLKIYRQYLECEIELAETRKDWGDPSNPEDIIEQLAMIQEIRRDKLGKEIADALFGTEVKVREYSLRRASIVADTDLYGAEKESRLEGLTSDMWGEESETVENFHKPYNRYKEKIKIYQRDISEMESETEKKELIREFRQEYFTPEITARLEQADEQREREMAVMTEWRKKKQAIEDNLELTADQKEQKIQGLTDDTFGDEAEVVKRREIMNDAMKSLSQ